MRTHTTYDSDKLLCILRSVSPTCDNNEADPYGYGTKSAIYGSISSAFPLTMVPGPL